MSRAQGETERTRANLLQVGVVQAADYSVARVRVLMGGLISAWLPWLAVRAGGDRTWAAPEVGEQVLVACPDGDPAGGVVLGAIYQQSAAAPASSADVTKTVYSDGAVIEYDRSSHTLTATLPSSGSAVVTAPQITVTAATGITVTTPTLTLNGNLTISGAISTGASANGGATIYGDITQINGSIMTDGDVTSDGDQVAGTVSQKSHVHSGVTPGGGNTGAPVA